MRLLRGLLFGFGGSVQADKGGWEILGRYTPLGSFEDASMSKLCNTDLCKELCKELCNDRYSLEKGYNLRIICYRPPVAA